MTEYTNTPILPEKAKELMSLDTEYKEIITYGKIEETLIDCKLHCTGCQRTGQSITAA